MDINSILHICRRWYCIADVGERGLNSEKRGCEFEFKSGEVNIFL